MSQNNSHEPPQLSSFGEVLRFYREHTAERFRPFRPGLAAIQLTAKEVAGCMSAAGVTVTAAVYVDIEQGLYLPKQPHQFIERAAICLGIEENSPEYLNLMDHLVVDLLKQRMGPDVAAIYRDALRQARQLGIAPSPHTKEDAKENVEADVEADAP